ncbi:MAG: hypothetical protein HW401_438 [Parcubacteria group bacterium]|nr:hypothetical protein [Parcubacteria group bacterium]
MKKQIVIIHGGKTFDSYEEYINSLKTRQVDIEKFKSKIDWRDSLRNNLGDSFEIIQPKMPNSNNAQYIEWKIWFERLVPFLDDSVILMGHSLGGIFLAKYLSENDFHRRIQSVILIAAPFESMDVKESLGTFKLPLSLEKFEKQGGQIFLFNSEDDDVVSFSSCLKYQKVLPGAQVRIFKNRQHFNQKEFLELVELIKSICAIILR